MESLVSTMRHRIEARARAEGMLTSARPLIPPAPRSAMFFPLVVLVAVLPGLYALNSWDMNPPGPWWGLRALAVLDGHLVDQVPASGELHLGAGIDANAYRTVALQPPLYAWLAAISLKVVPDLDPWAAVLPSYLAGAFLVGMTYFHGRLWRGSGHGLVAGVLTGFNCLLLDQMQAATPTTLALAGITLALFCYGRVLRVGSGPAWSWGLDGGLVWAVLGGLSLGASLLSLGWFALVCLPVVILHQMYLRAGSLPGERLERWWLTWRFNPSLVGGLIVMAIGLLLAAPWYLHMFNVYGFDFAAAILNPPDTLISGEPPGLIARLIDLAPATLPLGLFGVTRAIRQALTAETEDRGTVGGTFWILWLAVAAVVPTFWPGGPRSAFDLFLLIPLNLLAAQSILDLASRRVPVRTLTWLAPATAVSIAWWASADLRGAVAELAQGHAASRTALGLHLALDLLIACVVMTRGLDRWARRRDDRQRLVLTGFLLTVVITIVAAGMSKAHFRHKEHRELLTLRSIILNRHRAEPFDTLAVVGSEDATPGGRLPLLIETTVPEVNRRQVASVQDLLTLPTGRRLVILVGGDRRLSYALQAQLGLEALHPGGSAMLEAFATPRATRKTIGMR